MNMVKRKSLIVYFRTPKAIKLIDKVLPVVYYNIEDINEAHDKLHDGKMNGRALLKFVD